MTLKECYQRFWGDFEDVVGRLGSESFVERFLLRFPDDKSYGELNAALRSGDRDAAFRSAHTLKGLAFTLGITPIGRYASEATELLRSAEKIPDELYPICKSIDEYYEKTVLAISEYLGDKNQIL